MKPSEDYYAILGVDKNGTQKEIKAAYRNLALQFHPDRNRDNPEAVTRMKEVNEAYAVLSDSEKKQRYDAMRATFGSAARERFTGAYSQEDIFRGSDIHKIFDEFSKAFGLRGFEEIFRESYGPGFQRFEFRRPGFVGRGFVYRRQGPMQGRHEPRRISLPGNIGARWLQWGMQKILKQALPQPGLDWHDVITISPVLALQGGRIHYGHRRKGKELIVRIRPGIRSGQKIRLQGMGADGKRGGPPGDLYLQVRIQNPYLQKLKDFLASFLKFGK